ncbi:MAG: class C beta-lactamase-related serine hydrolase [Pseudomonadaceae bacterium]|nr:MAG: class C beta-lactamase-related serine hydrolase [Pseudomonadaceae bacterium]
MTIQHNRLATIGWSVLSRLSKVKASDNNKRELLMRRSQLTLALLASLSIASALADTSDAMNPADYRLDQLQLMQGFPPPADKQVTAANYLLQFPNLRWAFHHMRELLPSRNIHRGGQPTQPWPQGADQASKIDALSFNGPNGQPFSFADYLDLSYADATLILHNGEVIYEAYHQGMPAHHPHMLWSVTKSFTGLLASQMIHEGILDAEAQVTDYVPELADSGWQGASVQEVLNMTADIDYNEIYGDEKSNVFEYAMAAGMAPPPDDFTGYRTLTDYLPSIGRGPGEHGQDFVYRTVHSEVLGWILRRASQQSVSDLISERLWQQLGTEHDAYLLLDSQGTEWTGAGLNVTLRDLARVGELMRNQGNWHGTQVIASEVVQTITSGADREAFGASGRDFMPGFSYRNQWWISHDDDGSYYALGVHGQMIHVNPATGMVVVRLSSHPVASSAATMPYTLPAMAALADYLR